ncbi:hypothetical protein SteCoe_4635 [Stentor coeruleus]|uniref:B box-type domain-containing protein n=1 Tax=Stentor coeruleus TaxID=5963 RepID=A0A1R2CUG8_9CILI|nr:hypothetical protein SteCoe_4635 [Stentor coeruleus]
MDFKCFAENCSNKLKFYCSCKENLIFSCLAHIGQHADEDDESKHVLKAIYKTTDHDRKQYLIGKCEKISEILIKTQSLINQNIISMIESLTALKDATEKYYQNQRNEIQNIIEDLSQNNREVVVPGYKASDYCLEEIAYYNDNLSLKTNNLDKKLKADLTRFQELYKVSKFFSINWLDYKSNANLDQNLYFFRKGTKTFVEFDITTNSLSQFEANIQENQGGLPAVCQIPEGKIFYYGGIDPNLNFGYIIDLRTHIFEPIPQLRALSYTHATYYNEEVYIFTGHPGTVKCDKFNLAERTWLSLSNFPEGSVYSVSVLPCIDYFILSCSSGKKLYTYNFISNNYQLLTSSVENSTCNLLFRDGDKYYYLSKESYFTSHEGNLKIWTKSAKNLSQSILSITSKPVTRNRNVYFVSGKHHTVFKFDLDTESLSKVLTY